VLRELDMAKKAEEKTEEKKEVKKEVKKAPKAKQVTRVWNGTGWETVEEGDPRYKPGKQIL
tara:strand:+ start:227 stop:409 length:183 start_codon:yes stop_codon:yes gene_type:complete